MKKITFLFALLCASVMSWAGVAQDTWIPTTAPSTEVYAEQFKWFAISGENYEGVSVNQIEDHAGVIVIYVNFPDAGFDAVVGCERLDDAGALAFLKVSSLLTQENTDIYIKNGETVRWAFRIQNTKYSSGGSSTTFDPASVDWTSSVNTTTYYKVNDQFQIAAENAANMPTGPLNIQKPAWAAFEGIYIEVPAGVSACAFDDVAVTDGTEYDGNTGAGIVLNPSALTNEITKVTVTHGLGTTTFYVHNANASSGGETPTSTGICATQTYNSNVADYDIHAKVTKGCNKYYLTLTSATEGKTLTALVGDNMFCNRYSDEARTKTLQNYHMAASGHYTISEGAITFVIPSVGDPKMYTPLNVRFSDNTACEISGLNGVRLEPCSTEAAAACPDPDPEEIMDVNFALQSQGAVAYATSGAAGEAIDGNNGSRWESAHKSDPQTYTIDLGQRRIFNTFQIRWEGAYAKAFTIAVSNDGENWTNKVTETAYAGGNNVEYEAALGENVTARYIRFIGTERAETNYGYSFYEFRVLLKGVPVLTSVGLAANTTIAKVGDYAMLTPTPKDQNNGAIDATLSYTVTPADAGHVTDNKYYPEKYGLATITVTATTSNAEVTSNSVSVWGVLSNNLAFSSNISTDNKVIDQSEVTGDASSAFYAVDGNKGSVWQACRDLNDNKTNADFTSYYTLDLGSLYAINLIAIWFDGAASDQYTIEFSNDNSTWKPGFSITQSVGNYTHQKYLSLADLNNNDQVRYVRFTTTKASTTMGWGMKMFEMEVYGTEASTKKTVTATVSPESTGSVTIKTGDPLVEVTEVESGTSVTFTATPAEGYDFVNWTQGGVEVSTDAEYVTTVTANTALVANFELHRNVYCRTAIKTNNNKTLYLSCSKVANNTYQIRIDGSDEAKINGRNNFNFVIYHATDYSNEPYDSGTGHGWLVSNEGNGSIVNTFSANDYKNLSFGSHYFAIGAQGGGEFILDNYFPAANTIDWNSSCADETAPVMTAPTAVALNTTDVRLTLQATDNWAGTITYMVTYKPTGDEGEGTTITPAPTGASGEQVTIDVTGLTTNIEYTFTVTAKDVANNVCAAQTCKATPAGDVSAPTNVSITAVALSKTVVRLTLSADDDYAGDITYNIAYDNAGVASISAAQGVTTTLDITGLTANEDYHFSVVATDAANNSADAVNAAVVHTYAENLALNKPCEAGAIALPKAESNDGNKGSRWASGGSAVHSNDVTTSQDWWYVDLGHVYDIKNIRMYWEGARPSKYKFFVSNDATSWTPIADIQVSPEYSANASKVMDYLNDIDADAQGRYLKVWGYEDTNNNWAYGISFWELEAYGTLAVDAVAPVINYFEASGASTTSVLLRATADDNFKGDLTYTFYCNDVAQGEPVVKAAGVEATCTVNGLTMGTNYNFKVNVSDGTNNTMSDVVVGTPINDNAAPENVTVTSEATDYSITLTMSATDNLGGMIYYTVTCGETVKNAEALSGEDAVVVFDGLDYDTPYAFSIVAKDGSDNEAAAVAHNKSTLPATYPTSAAPAPAFAEASVRPVYSSAYSKDCNFSDWGGSYVEKQTYGAKKLNADKSYFGIVDFGTIKVDADDELYLSVWTNEDIQFRVVPIVHNEQESANLPERGALTGTLNGGQWNVVHFTMSDFNLDNLTPSTGYENFDKIYQIKIDNAGNQTFWLDNIYFLRKGSLNETNNADFIATNDNQGQDVKLSRTFPNTDEWYTLCLPFDLNDAQLTAALGAGYTVAEMVGAEDRGSLIHLNFDYIHSFEAGKAYLIRPGVGVTENPVFEGVTVKNVDPAALKSANTYMEFQGTFNAINLEGENKRFVGAENYLYSPRDSGTPMGAFRCYFTIPDGSPALIPGRRAKIFFGEQIITDIENVANDGQAIKFIENGQLFIIREGRTYNAQGMLVK